MNVPSATFSILDYLANIPPEIVKTFKISVKLSLFLLKLTNNYPTTEASPPYILAKSEARIISGPLTILAVF